MKTYVNKGVKHYTDIFSDLKSFDIITLSELQERDSKLVEFLKNDKVYNEVYFEEQPDSYLPKVVDQPLGILGTDSEIIYIEIPYDFINEWLDYWTSDVCLDVKKFVLGCDCYKCRGHGENHMTWKEIKSKILSEEKFRISEQKQENRYEVYKLYRDYGIMRPIYNISPHWPRVGTHRLNYTAIVKSDIPMFFPKDYCLRENIVGAVPYFKGCTYSQLNINEDRVEFYVDNKLVGVLKNDSNIT